MRSGLVGAARALGEELGVLQLEGFDGVTQQHGDSHRAHATGHWRDERRNLFAIAIASEWHCI